jgi:DNA-binding transcriptional ArsR family regulator
MESFSSLMAHLAHEIRTKDPARDPDHEALDGPHVGDTLVALRAVAFEHLGDTTPIVLLDGLEATLRHELFGRQRDELWEIPIRWVISGRSALAPPADTFFEAVVTLDHLDPASMRELLLRRAATGTEDERHRLEQLANTLPLLLDPATPRQLLATARTAMLSAEPDLVLDQLQRRRNARVHLSPTADRVLDALSSLGPTHAGDERLLEEIGTTRSRVVQVLRELEDAGLVRSVRDGRRKLYGADIGDDFVVEDPDSGEIAVVEPKRKRNAR